MDLDAIIDIRGRDLRCLGVAGGSEYRIDALEATSALRGFARRYERTLKDVDAQRSLGQEMAAWLDRTGWISHWLAQPGARRLCVQLASSDGGTALGLALLDAPWELLTAPGDDFLALDGVQPFLVLRRVGAPAEPWAPAYKNLSLLFMAAAPQGERELDCEAEEAAILGATEKALVQLHVEETGSLEGLAYRVSEDGPFEALHISCHGAQDSTLGAVLALENDYGACDLASPENLVTCLDDTTRLPLVFLSACQTAEQVEGAEGFPVESFVRALLRAGVANVLGWDGSVRDADAILFAQSLYAALGQWGGLPEAVEQARRGLLRAHLDDRSQGTHWHLARLYLGPAGGGALVSNKKPRHALLANQTHAQQFLDGAHAQVPVATRAAFVGRRREIQQALRLLQDETLPGVLIQGMGNLGKSSLAARIASRLTKHSPVVVFGRYDASTVFERMLAAVPASARSAYKNTWQAAIDADESALADALEALLLGPELLEKPVLLVVDDLERILEQPAPGQALTPVSAGHRQALAALLRAFQQARSQGSPSCLLITSRYRFTLPDSWGANQAEALGVLPLRPMPLRERQKQFAAAQRLAALAEPTPEQLTLAREAQALAEGNPGLQDILTKPILNGELAAARSAQGAIRQFLAQGPGGLDAQSLHDFFARMSFEHYTQALQPQERQVLRIACIFSPGQPIPQAALEAAAQACAMRTAPPAISRLLGLGLLDDWGCLDTPPVLHLSINPLARPLVIQDPLDEAPPALAGLDALLECWQTADGMLPEDPRNVELASLVLKIPDLDPAQGQALANAAGWYLFKQTHDARSALALIQPILERSQAQAAPMRFDLLAIAEECAERLGEVDLRQQLLAWMPEAAGESEADQAAQLFRQAGALTHHDPDTAESLYRQALVKLERLGDVRSVAVTQGKIADILQARGQLDEALRIFTDQISVFEKLSDVRSVAVILGKIANILQTRGQLGEALRIHTELQLPVYEELGDVRERAITQGQIADILELRGQLDEALRIRTELQLPVYEKLGDVRSVAVTQGKIADILQSRGQLDEALRIRTELQLPVYEELGDVRERAITQGQIPDILELRGQLDEALRIRTELQLPVYEELGDVRSVAMTQGRIAEILLARGRLDEALELHAKRLPVAQSMQDLDSLAHIRFSMAVVRWMRGDLEQDKEAIRTIFLEMKEAYGLVTQLGRVEAVGSVGIFWAQILALADQPQAAHQVLNEAEAAFRLLKNVQGLATLQTLRQRIPSA